MCEQFDVFLCHNSQDKPEVIEIAQQLQRRGLKSWLDVRDLRPGLSWQAELGKQIENIKSAAVFVGRSGIGPWQEEEIDAFLRQFKKRECPVIPVLLADAPKKPDIPIFLEGMMWVDFRQSESDPMEQLIWGITGIKPEVAINPGFPSIQVFEFDVVTLNTQGQEIMRNRCQNLYFEENLGNGIVMEMVWIPGGSCQMGTPEGEGRDSERPQHEVTVKPFFMGKYPVTQAQWRAIASLTTGKRDLNPEPSRFKGDNRPVEQVSWYDVVDFCEMLSRKTGRVYRMPSEAEWEYACRAGTTTPFHFGPKITCEFVNCKRNFGTAFIGAFGIGETSKVGNFRVANAFGLYDMHGNVWEWCVDLWHKNYEGAPTDDHFWIQNNRIDILDNFVMRGGSWNRNPFACRSAHRCPLWGVSKNGDVGLGSVGLRVVCEVQKTA